MKRSPLRPVSKKRAKANVERRKVLIEKYGLPDTWSCELQTIIGTVCAGAIHGHELLKRSRGGSITDPDNIMLACDFHNGWVEDFPLLASELGLSKHSWEALKEEK